MRDAAVQLWPWRVKRIEVSAPETVLSKSQSAKTIIGDLPPSSSVTGISFSAAALRDDLAGLDRAGEGHLAHQRVATSGAPHSGPKPGQHVEAAGRQHAVHQLADAQHRERRLLGRLHHHRVARHQRRRDLQRHQQHRHVPGDDGADHAERLAHRHAQHVRREGHALALQLAAQAAEEFEDVGDDAGLDAALGAQRLAGFQRDQPRQFLDYAPSAAAAQACTSAPRLRAGTLRPFLLRARRRSAPRRRRRRHRPRRRGRPRCRWPGSPPRRSCRCGPAHSRRR